MMPSRTRLRNSRPTCPAQRGCVGGAAATLCGSFDAGVQTIPLRQIRGSECRAADFGADFLPRQEHTRDRFDPLCLIFLVVMALYMIVLEGWLGATLGKRLVGLRVVRVGGGRPGLWRSLVRNVLRAVDSLPTLNILGVILILRSPERARFGDRVAGTRVVWAR